MQRRPALALAAVWLAVGLATVLVLAGLPFGVAAAAQSGPSALAGDSGASPAVAGADWDGGSAAGRAGDAAVQSDAIVETVTYRLLPDEPDRVEATIRYEIPDDVRELEFAVAGGRYDVEATEEFTAAENGGFEWSGDGSGGSVTIRHDVTESFRAEPPTERYVGGTADWAIVARPQTTVNYNYVGSEPDVVYRLTVDGEGYAGERLAYVGPYSEHATTVDGERLTLVVPEAADTASSPAELLDSMAYASDRLRVGNRNDEVVAIAAPTDEVEWGPPGLSIGPDLRVAADTPVDEPVNVWIHEYVHTRQQRDSPDPSTEAIAADARWLVEGSANYYGALYNLQLGHTEFAEFRRVLERGTRDPETDATLADPGTWQSDAEYDKGALVAGAVDLRLRAASDGEASLQQVLAAWNRQERFDADDLEAAVESHGDASVREFVAEHTRTDATPDPWDRDAHATHFDTEIARFAYEATGDPALEVTGPYRQAALPDTVVVGETVATEVTVRNVGEVEGPYSAVLAVDGAVVAEATGRLSAGESAVVDLSHTFDSTGEVTVRAGDRSRTVTVREPADPHVGELTAQPRRPAPDESVRVEAEVTNPADRPAVGTVAVDVDGARLASEEVRLAPGETTTVVANTSFADPGDRRITTATLGVNVSVREGNSLDALPGPGVGTAAIALLLGALVLVRRP